MTSYTVRCAARSLSPKLSTGPDCIPAFFIKAVMPALSFPLSLLFQWSLDTSYCPPSYKTSIVKPVWKRKKSKTSVSSYRPISLLSAIPKLHEKIVVDLILKHCQRRNLLSESQFGFLPGRSVTCQLLLCLNDWSRSVRNMRPCYVMYSDFSSAFQRVEHSKLLIKLKAFGTSSSCPLDISWC